MMQKIKKPLILGVDLGCTKIKTALVDPGGRILASALRPTHPEKGPEGVIAEAVASIEECRTDKKCKAQAVGVGVAGQVDGSTGTVRFAPNLRWKEVPLGRRLEKAVRLPVYVTNDVRAAAFGEWKHGAGRGETDLVVLFVGTGIGGGVISSGRMLDGSTNTAGELGHMTIKVGGRRCHCPNRGCLEAYAGGWAIAERAQEAVRNNPEGGELLTSLAGGIENITAATVSKAYLEGDALARELVGETVQYLSAGAVSIVNAFNPRLLVMGGGVVEGLPELVQMVEKSVREKALKSAASGVQVVQASLGDDAGSIGAAALARIKLESASL